MARRRFMKRAKAYARRGVRYVRASYAPKRRPTHSGQNPLMNVILPSVAYGAVRQTAKSYTDPIIPKFLGDNTDEAVYGLAGYLLMRYTNGFTHDFGRAMLTVEAASVGHNVFNPMLQGMAGSGTTTQSGILIGGF